MTYGDDFLNVYGLLQKKTCDNNTQLLKIAEQHQKNEQLRDTIASKADDMECRISALSKKSGLEMPDLENDADNESEYACDLNIRISSDYDYTSAFNALVQEATKEGFTDTKPEDLLSTDDMKKAKERNRRLDADFYRKTGLRAKDVGILFIATAIKIVMYYFNKYGLHFSENLKEAGSANTSGKETPLVVDAMQGVDLSTIKEINSFADLVNSADGILAKMRGGKPKLTRILDKQSILDEPVPFDIPDNKFFLREEVLGFDSIMGWLFGVINFMTNTVTTKKFSSYSVVRGGNGHIGVGDKLSTPIHIMLPVVKGVKKQKESIVAAMVREAHVLNVAHAPYETVQTLMQTAFHEEDQIKNTISFGKSFISSEKIDIVKTIKDSSLIAFIDTITAAICAVVYNPDSDGNIEYYSLRMHKVLLMSNAFAAIANNIPAIMTKNVMDIDFSSILYTLLGLFHSTKYWIEVKSEYLASEYKKVLDEELGKLDKYFTVTN